MKAIEIAKELYRKFGENFELDLLFFKKNGYIIETDDSFWMFRRHPDRSDCWAIQMAVGNLSVWETIMPFPLPYMAWARGSKGKGIRFRRTNHFIKTVKKLGKK